MKLKTRKPAIIFDLDGTLVNTIPSLAKSGNDLLAYYGLDPLPEENYRYYAGNGSKKLVERVLRDAGRPDLDLDQAHQVYLQGFETTCTYGLKPYPGLVDLVSDLHQAGVTLAILTNKPQAMADQVVPLCYPIDQFSLVVGQREGVPLKPDPAAPLGLIDRLRIKPEDCYFIGDSGVDMEMAKKGGFTAIGVLWGFRPAEELEEMGAQYLAQDAAELRQLLFVD